MVKIFERIREERKRLKLNQTDFAEKCGVGLGSQVRYESGERLPDAGYLAAIADLGADVMYILTGVRSGVSESPLLTRDLPPRMACLLDNYQHCTEEDQAAVERLASLAAQSKRVKEGGKKVG